MLIRSPLLLAALAIALPVATGADAHAEAIPSSQDLKKLQLAPGLKIELVAREPLLSNPVAFSIDAHGRFFIAETHRYGSAVFDITANTPWLLDDLSCRTVNDRAAFLARTFATNVARLTNTAEVIRLVEDKDHDGTAETSSVFVDGFRNPVAGPVAGVLAQGTNVWMTCIPDLWRFTAPPPPASSPGPKPESVSPTRLASGLGVHISVSGHDVHGLIRGPDGRVYFSFGDRGICVTNREGEVLEVPDTGGVLRCEPDGSNLETVCVGLRNPQELAFDDLGNLWTVDNDTAGADPCRVLHVVEGGDYGWRSSYQHMKGFGPWVQEELWRGGLDGVLPPAGTVSQGPAGLAFHPGTSLTPQFNGMFLHADFPGGIWAFNVRPRGASFELGAKTKVLWNCWPTDVDFGPDGALYVLDWVQGWTPPGQGRIYRLTGTNVPDAQATLQVKRLLAEGMAQRSPRDLLNLLAHADRRVRLEAQWELAARGTNSLAALAGAAQSSPSLWGRLHALWGFRQIIRGSDLPALEPLAALLPLLEDSEAEVRGQAALAMGEALFFNAQAPMSPLLQDSSSRARLLVVQGYTHHFRSRFGLGQGAKRSRPARTYFSKTQKVVGAIANKAANAVGADATKASLAVGGAIVGKYPVLELNRALPTYRTDPFLLHAAMDFLIHTRASTAFESHFAINPSPESALVLLWANRRTGNPAVGDFFTNSAPRLILEAARAINDTPISAAYPALAALLEQPRFMDANWGWAALSNVSPAGPFSAQVRSPRDQVLRRALNASFRLGGGNDAKALVRFALGSRSSGSSPKPAQAPTPAWPNSLRAEALFLLGAWEVLPAKVGDLSIKPQKDPNHGSVPSVNPENWPGWFDRVVGLWRPLPVRSPAMAQAALRPAIVSLLQDPSDEVAIAAIEASVKLALVDQAAPTLLARLTATNGSVAVRQRIPGALAALRAPQLGDALVTALADGNASIRAAALPYLNRLEGDFALSVLAPILKAAIQNPPAAQATADLRLAQAALRALQGIKSPAADSLLATLVSGSASGKAPPSLELDLIDAMEGRSNPALQDWLKRRPTATASNELGAWRPTLAGGDAAQGRSIFFEKVEVQCSRCHQIKKDGGTVGPALDAVGQRLSREALLESILRPNKVIAPGFESVLVTLQNGEDHSGVVKSETESELRIESPEEGLVTMAKSNIRDRRASLSAMPEGLAEALTRRELRDLIEFLAGLR